MNVAVTGGTGFVGRHLVERLLAEDHNVTVLTHEISGKRLLPAGAKLVQGSVDSMESLETAFEGAETVYHLVGIIAETKTKTFEKTVVGGTRNVLAACTQAGVKKIIYLSAMGTSAEAQTKYHRTKYDAEQIVMSSGADYVILRPSVVYGPGDGFVGLLKRLIEASFVTPVIGDGKYQLQPVYIDDLTSTLVQCLTVADSNGKIIEIGGPEKLEYLEILDIIKRVMGKSRVNFHIPLWVMKPIAFCLERMVKPAPVTVDQLAMMKMGNTGDISEMKELFGINPVEFEQGLRKYLRWENGGN